MKYALWSGGLDSTILVYYLGQDDIVQSLHLEIQTVAESHQRRVVKELSAELEDKFPNVLPVKIINDWQWQFSKFPRAKGNRNLRICEFMGKLGYERIYMGGYFQGSHFPDDNNPQLLSKRSGVDAWNWERLQPGIGKEGVFKIGLDLLGEDVLRKTWSCQLWWSEPCRLCFSCIERETLFLKYTGRR